MSNFLEGVQRAVNTIRNTKIDVDYNPFNDGKVEVGISSGKASISAGIGLNAIGATAGAIESRVNRMGPGFGRNIGIQSLGASVKANLEGVGGVNVSVGASPHEGKVRFIPGLSVTNAQGRTVASTDLIENAQEIIKSIGETLEAETNAAEAKAAGESVRFPGRNSGNRSPQSRPQTQNRPNQQQQSRQTRPQSPSLPGGTPQTIPQFGTPQQTRQKGISDEDWIAQGETFKPAQTGGSLSTGKSTEAQSGTGRRSGGRSLSPQSEPRRENVPKQQPFTIPTDIPKTNTRLPRKPQIGGNTAQQNSGTNQRNGGIALGGNTARQNSSTSQRNGGISLGGNGAPQQDNRVNQRNSGRTIVSPEELEDISANNPNNKPRIVQPQQNSEPRSAYRLLNTREIQLFNCIQNGGGDACNQRYGESPRANASGSSGGNNEVSLQFGDPYIGLGNF